jgi:hypothetical protein
MAVYRIRDPRADKPTVDEVHTMTIDITGAVFEVNDKGDLVVRKQSTKELIGYFPKDQWSCVYTTDD